MRRKLYRLWEICAIAVSLVVQTFRDARIIGFRAAVVLFYAEVTSRRLLRFLGPRGPRRLLKLKMRGFRHPLYVRHGTTDLSVVRQVFCHEEYSCVLGIQSPRLIVDCGANIGCTSFYLLHHFPDAKVVAVEPDGGNYEVCKRNLAPFGDQVTLLRKGVWPQAAALRVVEGTGGKVEWAKGEWAMEVRPCLSGEQPDVEGVTIPDILEQTQQDQIDLLKVDIEGAERYLFAEGTDAWLGLTRNIVIELHGEECTRVFFDALRGYRYSQQHRGELLLCSAIS